MLYLLNSLSKTSIFPGLLIVLTFHVAIFNCCRLFSFITSRVSLPSGSTPATSGVVLPVGFGTVPSWSGLLPPGQDLDSADPSPVARELDNVLGVSTFPIHSIFLCGCTVILFHHLSSAALLGDSVVASCSFPHRRIEPVSWLPVLASIKILGYR